MSHIISQAEVLATFFQSPECHTCFQTCNTSLPFKGAERDRSSPPVEDALNDNYKHQ